MNVDTGQFAALTEQVAALADELTRCRQLQFDLTVDVELLCRGLPAGRPGRPERRRRGPGERPAHLRLVRGGAG